MDGLERALSGPTRTTRKTLNFFSGFGNDIRPARGRVITAIRLGRKYEDFAPGDVIDITDNGNVTGTAVVLSRKHAFFGALTPQDFYRQMNGKKSPCATTTALRRIYTKAAGKPVSVNRKSEVTVLVLRYL